MEDVLTSVNLGMPAAPPPTLAPRRKTRQIKVGSVGVGSDFPISVQSMTTTPTTDINATLQQIAELTADYLKLLYGKAPHPEQRLHWLVSLMKRHADDMYRTGISLKELAVTCRKNEKYLGRLFKKEMGMGFHDYCTQLRLREAEQRLLQSDEKVIDVAFACGFNNVSYFNRVFKAKHGVSPRAYRADRKHMDIDDGL